MGRKQREKTGARKVAKGTPSATHHMTARKASRVLNAAEFGSPPNSLQVAKLTRRMRGSGVQVSDLENSDGWKDKHLEWWEEQGAVFVERLQEKWKARAAGGGAMTDNMLKGKYLSVPRLCCGR